MSARFALATLAGVFSLLVIGCSQNPDVLKREAIKNGDRYVAEHKYREATVEYRKALQLDPRLGEVRLKLAEVYDQLGEGKNAAGEYIRAADLLPDDSRAQIKAGLVLLLGRKYEDAQTRAENVLKRDKKNVEAQILRGNALAGLKRLDEGIKDVEEAIRLNPDRSQSYSMLAELQSSAGRMDKAREAFETAVNLDPKSVVARLALANFYWSAGDREKSEEHLLQAISANPRDPLVNRSLAAFYRSTARAAQAEPYLKTLAEVAPDAQGKVLLADFYAVNGRAGEAKSLYESISPDHEDGYVLARLRLADLAANAGDSSASTKLVDEVLSKFPNRQETLLAKAQMLLDGQKLEEALQQARKAAEMNPRSSAAQFAMGKILAARNAPDEAIAAFNEVAKINPRLVSVDVELARARLQLGQYDQAREAAQNALRKAPNYVEAQLLLARADLLSGQFGDAERALNSAAKDLPKSAAINTELGVLHLQRGNIVAARAAFTRALAVQPHYPDAVNAMVQLDLRDKKPDAARERLAAAIKAKPGDMRLLMASSQMHVALREVDQAENDLRQIIQIQPNNLKAYENLGLLYASEHRLDESIAEFRKLAERQPKNIGARTVIGLMLDLQHKADEAKVAYQEVLKVDDKAAVAANNLAWLYADRGENLDEALNLAQTAKSGLPDSPAVSDTLGWIYFKKGLVEQAIPLLLTASQQQPGNALFQYHLGLAYQKFGNLPAARRALEATMKLAPTSNEAAGARQVLSKITVVGS